MFATGDSEGCSDADLSAVLALMERLLSCHPGLAGTAALEHIASGGKRVRARLALHSARRLGLQPSSAIAIAAASELLHNASLVHDDVQDRSAMRRGCSALWTRYGADIAICSGDLLISAGYGALAGAQGAGLPDAMARMHHRVSEVIAGQSADLAAKDTVAVSLFRYKQMAAAKSAPLLGLPIELSLLLAGRADCIEQVEQAAIAFAVAYQMADDIEDAVDDIANGEVNIVGILAREASFDVALSLARSHVAKTYRIAADLASDLPSGCGALLAMLASDCAQKAQNRSVPA